MTSSAFRKRKTGSHANLQPHKDDLMFARSKTYFLSTSASLQDVGAVVVIYSPLYFPQRHICSDDYLVAVTCGRGSPVRNALDIAERAPRFDRTGQQLRQETGKRAARQ